MRVITGRLGGRNFDSPHGHRTHPMSEKMRGAIFGALGDITGLTVLDAFSGSGALAIEAVSRGAKSALAIDADKRAYQTIKSNLELLGLTEQIQAVRAFAGSWSTRHQANIFDLILLDPPYDHIPYRDLDRLKRHLVPDGVLVLSWPNKVDLPKWPDLQLLQVKNYGDSQLIFYRHT